MKPEGFEVSLFAFLMDSKSERRSFAALYGASHTANACQCMN